jgi:hypothetical protein
VTMSVCLRVRSTVVIIRSLPTVVEVTEMSPRLPEREAATVPRLKVPRMADFEEWATVPEGEGVRLEVRDMPEFEFEAPVVAEPEDETLVVKVTEVPRLEMPRLSEEAMVESETMVPHVQLCARVRCEMPKAEAVVACRGRLRSHPQHRQDGCEQHDPAHHVAP